MPYKSVSDLPAAQVDQYSPHQKKAFLEAFNNAYEEYGGDESRAFAVAHSAAKKAGGTSSRSSESRSGRTKRAER
jgi:cation transport regulator